MRNHTAMVALTIEVPVQDGAFPSLSRNPLLRDAGVPKLLAGTRTSSVVLQAFRFSLFSCTASCYKDGRPSAFSFKYLLFDLLSLSISVFPSALAFLETIDFSIYKHGFQ